MREFMIRAWSNAKEVLSTAFNISKILTIHAFIGVPYMFLVSMVYSIMWLMEGELLNMEMLESKLAALMATQIPVTMMLSAVLSFLIYKWMMKKRNRNIYEVCRFNKLSWDKSIVSFLSGMSFIFVSLVILNVISYFFTDVVQNHEENMASIQQGGVLLLILNAGIFAPFIEEIMFRGLIFDELESKVSLKLTVIIQGLIFGIYHLNIAQGFYASLLGLVLGLSLIWTGSIWAPILMHLGNNLFSVFLGTLGIDGNPSLIITLSVVAVFGVLPFTLIYLYKNRIPFTPRRNNFYQTL